MAGALEIKLTKDRLREENQCLLAYVMHINRGETVLSDTREWLNLELK